MESSSLILPTNLPAFPVWSCCGGRCLSDEGYTVVNVDATVLAQAPKLAPYREQMRANIAEMLETDVSRVSVKATTEERLGFTGSGEGMAAHAVALLERTEN